MLRIEEAEEQRDCDGIDARRRKRRNQSFDLVLRQRGDDATIGSDALGDFKASAARDEGCRRVLEEIVEVRARRAPPAPPAAHSPPLWSRAKAARLHQRSRDGAPSPSRARRSRRQRDLAAWS